VSTPDHSNKWRSSSSISLGMATVCEISSRSKLGNADEPKKGLLDRVSVMSNSLAISACEGRRFVHEHFLHLLEEPQNCPRSILVPQPRITFQNGQGPTAFVKFGRLSICRFAQHRRAHAHEAPRMELAASFSSLECHGLTPFVGQKMFHRRKR